MIMMSWYEWYIFFGWVLNHWKPNRSLVVMRCNSRTAGVQREWSTRRTCRQQPQGSSCLLWSWSPWHLRFTTPLGFCKSLSQRFFQLCRNKFVICIQPTRGLSTGGERSTVVLMSTSPKKQTLRLRMASRIDVISVFWSAEASPF